MEKRFLPDLTIHQWNSYFPNWRRGSNWASWMATSENIDPHLGRNSVANRMFFSILDIVLKCASAIVRRLGAFQSRQGQGPVIGGGLPGFKIDGVSSMLQSKFWTKGANFLANSANSKPHVHPPRVWVPQQLHFEDHPGGKHPSPGARRVEGRPGPVGSEWKRIMENTCLSTYIYIYLCVCACVYLYLSTSIYIYLSPSVYLYLSTMYIYLYLSTSIYIIFTIFLYLSIYIYIYIYVYICIYIYISLSLSLSIYILLYFLQNVDRIEFSGWSRIAKLMHCHIWRKPCKFLRKVILQASSKPMMSFWSFGNNKGPVWMVWRTMCETWNKPLFVHQIINTPLSAKADQNTPRKRKSIRLCPIISPYIPMVSCGHEKKWHLVPAPHVASGPSHALTQPGLAIGV